MGICFSKNGKKIWDSRIQIAIAPADIFFT